MRLLQIDNHEERGDPAEDAELDEVILDEAFSGGTAEAENNHVLEIAQKTCKNPTTGEIDITCTHSLDDLWRHGVHDVANQCDRSNDCSSLVDESLIVTSNRNTRFRARLFIDPIVIVALGESQEKRYKECHHHQPMGNPDIRCHTTHQHSHHKTNGDNRHIEDSILLQPDTIGNIHQPIAHHYYI